MNYENFNDFFKGLRQEKDITTKDKVLMVEDYIQQYTFRMLTEIMRNEELKKHQKTLELLENEKIFYDSILEGSK